MNDTSRKHVKQKIIFIYIYNNIILYSFYDIIKYERPPEFKALEHLHRIIKREDMNLNKGNREVSFGKN